MAFYLPAFARYQVERLSDNWQVFENTDCENTQTCDLKKFSLRVTKIKNAFNDDWSDMGLMTLSSAYYETDQVDNLENYAIVQFIRGCVWGLGKENENWKVQHNLVRDFFGKSIHFQHPEWVIDSIDQDPMYGTWDDLPRHYAYRWNKTPHLHPQLDVIEKYYYGQSRPHKPSLYVTDSPNGGRLVNQNEVQNSTLEFKTCIYKTKDIPLKSNPEDLDFAKPIHCFSWGSYDVFDPSTQSFDHTPQVNPICQDDWEN